MEREVEVDVRRAEAGDRPEGRLAGQGPALESPSASTTGLSEAGGPAQQGPQALTLPVLVFGVVEVRRLKRELEALDEFIHQAEIREPGKQAALPRVSRLLDALANDNNLNLLQSEARDQLKAFLVAIEQTAPTINISFASDPSASFTSKIVGWLRGNIHPQALLQVGLQPTIAAGCIVRTASKRFDFSLRQRFTDQQPLLLQALDDPMIKTVPTPEAANI